MCTTFTYFREVHLQTWNVCMQTTQLWTQTLYAMYIEITWMCKPLCIQSMYSSFIIDFRQSELFYWLNKNFLWEHLKNICTKNQGYLVTWHIYIQRRPLKFCCSLWEREANTIHILHHKQCILNRKWFSFST